MGVALPGSVAARPATRFLLAWNSGVLVYLALAAHMCWTSSDAVIRQRARRQAESKFMTLLLVLLAASAAMAAILAELVVVKDMNGLLKVLHIGLTALTIVSAWAFTHLMFGLHYAHDYYEALDRQQPPGLDFPGTDDPTYGDFLYCAFIIGTSGQTADVEFTSKAMRRVGGVHSVFAFFFNTTLLALTINIASSLM